MRDFEINVSVNPVECDTCVYAVMSDYNDVRGTLNEREPITFKMNFACGFTVEEIVSIASCELAVKWFTKYGVDKYGNSTGILTKINISEEC